MSIKISNEKVLKIINKSFNCRALKYNDKVKTINAAYKKDIGQRDFFWKFFFVIFLLTKISKKLNIPAKNITNNK